MWRAARMRHRRAAGWRTRAPRSRALRPWAVARTGSTAVFGLGGEIASGPATGHLSAPRMCRLLGRRQAYRPCKLQQPWPGLPCMLARLLDSAPVPASLRTDGRDAGAPEEGAALLQQLAAGAAAGGRFGDAARHTLALALVGIAPAPPPAARRPAPTARALALFWERLGTAEAYAAYSLVHAAAAARSAPAAAAAAAAAAPGPAPAAGPAAAPLPDPRASSRAEALGPPGARADGARQTAGPLGPGGLAQAAGPGGRAGAPGGGGPQAAAPRGAAAPATTLLNAAHFLLAHLPPVRWRSIAPLRHNLRTSSSFRNAQDFLQACPAAGWSTCALPALSQQWPHAAPAAAADTHAQRRLSRPMFARRLQGKPARISRHGVQGP